MKNLKQKIWLFVFILFVTFYTAFVLVTLPTEVITYQRIEPVVEFNPIVLDPIAEPKVAKIQVPMLYPTLKKICTCESGQGTGEPQQFNIKTGEVLRGEINPLDTGMCQINLKYHQASAEKMGLDLETEYGNAMYANWLFDTQGSQPWDWSRSCWSK